MNISTQDDVDKLYIALQEFDPGVRNGEVHIKANDTEPQKQEKLARIEAYKKACDTFGVECQNRVERIQNFYVQNRSQLLDIYPLNLIRDTWEYPMVGLEQYEELISAIYKQNKEFIDSQVDEKFSNMTLAQRTIRRERFHLEFWRANNKSPRIIIGPSWNFPDPLIFEVDWSLQIIQKNT